MTQGEKIAVILDIVDSRQLADRSRVQADLERAFAVVDERTAPVEPLTATVGDEFQAVYANLSDALEATLLARLAMPDAVDCRFGIGAGDIRPVGTGMTGILQDGTAWWAAREAIDEAHRRADTRVPSLRSWYRSSAGDASAMATVNAYLLSRDHLVSAMGARERRLALGTWLGRSQAALAVEEQISQSAVSQSLRRSGVTALQAGMQQLREAGAGAGADPEADADARAGAAEGAPC